MPIDAMSLGFVLAIVGIGLFFWREKRKYDRTNTAGVEQFNSFVGKIAATSLDELLRWIAIGLLFVGLFMMAFA